jgi:beta-galactosidase
VPGRRFDEFVRFSQEAGKLAPLLEGTTLHHDVAMLFSHEQLNAFQIQPQSDGFDYLDNFKRVHSALLRMGIGTDVLNWRDDFLQYKLVIAPMLYLIDDAMAAKLRQYVDNGGTLILTTRSGVKNMNNVCLPDRLPNFLTELAGVFVDEYDPIGNDVQRIEFEGGELFKCSQWCDILSPVTAETIATYSSEYFAGRAAVTRNVASNGTVYYIGTVLDDEAYRVLLGRIAKDVGLDCEPDLPEGVELAVRSSDTTRLLFAMNLSKESKRITLDDREFVSALSGKRLPEGSIELLPGDVEILVKTLSEV